ncbi:MAG: CapA family protein [Chloroflexi bacterium]|nr:CapA family protein [Chloroflexota bacterium]
MSRQIKIIIGGDTVPTKSNETYLMNDQENLIFNKIKDVFSAADITIINLECPLTNSNKPIIKIGPCLKAHPKTIDGLVNVGINVFSLANNHIMDFGNKGLQDTLSLIRGKNALSVGAGENLASARKILYIHKQGNNIALISSAEHEFSIAQEDYPGANPFDPFDTIDDIREAHKEADLTIVLFHGGIEHYQYPSPSLQKLCHRMVEEGADVVICQHSHCVGSYETHQNGHIIYGQGNMLFDYSTVPMWQTGMLVEITLENMHKNIGFIPIIKKGFTIDIAEGKDKENILNEFEERSRGINDKDTIKNKWDAFCLSRKYHYIHSFLGFGWLLHRIDYKLNHIFSNILLNKFKLVTLYGFINCESHYSVIRTFLENNYRES